MAVPSEAKVCVLDYGSGNVKSVFNLVRTLTDQVSVSNTSSEILAATHLVLPGVGAFGAAMQRIKEHLPMDALEQAVHVNKIPFLGICVGMQVLADRGFEFGEFAGLGWIAGEVSRLDAPEFPLPHVGWNNVTSKNSSALMAGLENNPDFYFVHSYVFRPRDPDLVVATAQYGEAFCAVLKKQNVMGVQFHPEKSQSAGKRLMANFLGIK